jgi:mono/diheme cytochrome c family protein
MRAAAILAAVILVPAALAGCASDDASQDDQVAGKQLFVKNCGACHVLDRAGTKGTTGPNLDEAFQQSLSEGFGRNAVRGMVRKQIEYPNKKGVMPADLVTGTQADDIAAYVAGAVAAKGQDTGVLADAVKPAGAGKPVAAVNGVLTNPADPSGQLQYVSNKATASPGPLVLSMPNTSGVDHNVALQEGTNGAVIAQSPIVKSGDSKTKPVDVKAGTYTFFCEVPGHRAAGMVGTLVVK